MLLKLQGHQVWIAHDGPAALRAADDRCPDVVLLDIGLPGMNGYEVARRIRRDGSFMPIGAGGTGCGRRQRESITTWSSPSTSTSWTRSWRASTREGEGLALLAQDIPA